MTRAWLSKLDKRLRSKMTALRTNNDSSEAMSAYWNAKHLQLTKGLNKALQVLLTFETIESTRAQVIYQHMDRQLT